MDPYHGIATYIQCDATECTAEQRVWDDSLPQGWIKRGKRTYCPDHGRHVVNPDR